MKLTLNIKDGDEQLEELVLADGFDLTDENDCVQYTNNKSTEVGGFGKAENAISFDYIGGKYTASVHTPKGFVTVPMDDEFSEYITEDGNLDIRIKPNLPFVLEIGEKKAILEVKK